MNRRDFMRSVLLTIGLALGGAGGQKAAEVKGVKGPVDWAVGTWVTISDSSSMDGTYRITGHADAWRFG